MAESVKALKLPEARALAAEGVANDEIARSVGVAVRTVQKWAREDALNGRPWRSGHPPTTLPPTAKRRAACACLTPAGCAGAGALPSPLPSYPDESPTDRVCRVLEQRLDRAIDELSGCEPAAAEAAKLEDRVLKLCKVIEAMRHGRDDIGLQLSAIDRFADYCLQNLTEEEMQPVRTAISMFLEDLRRENL